MEDCNKCIDRALVKIIVKVVKKYETKMGPYSPIKYVHLAENS